MNPILLTDSYKVSHYLQYPPGTTNIYSYFESRGGMFGNITFFGLQYYLKEYLSTPVTMAHIDEAESMFKLHMPDTPFNRQGWEHIVNKHDGKLPLRIKAVPEGMSVPTRNVLMTVENTDPECFWLTNYVETILSQIWYGCTVATLSREMKTLIKSYLEKTGDPSLINFKLHDFGFRGVSSVESAGIGGCAHLVNFMGTDTIAALQVAKKYYNCEMAGYSIPAAEHSTITSWGRDGEIDAYRNMIKQYGSGSMYAVVSDSYDIYSACGKLWGDKLKSEVENANGTLIVRPDSGVPHDVVLACLNILGDKFGFTYNSKGYKVLNPKVRVIQGDGINYDATRLILTTLERAGWSADNVAFGMGGGLLQQLNRDTQKFAFKCSSATIRGNTIDVFKSPITDSNKVSKKGRLSLIKKNGTLQTYGGEHKDDLLQLVYENGVILREESLDNIRERSNC